MKITLNVPGLSRARIEFLSDYFGQPIEEVLKKSLQDFLDLADEDTLAEARMQDEEMFKKIIPFPRL